MKFTKTQALLLFSGCGLAAAVALVFWAGSGGGRRGVEPAAAVKEASASERVQAERGAMRARLKAEEKRVKKSEGQEPGDDKAKQAVEEETSSKEDVVAFEALVDAYTDDKRKQSFSKAELAAFFKALDKLRGKDREVALSQMLDMLSDRRYELAAVILFKTSTPLEDAELVYHDLLNRPDEIKYPLLRQLAEQSGHPLSQDAREVLEATGELELE